MVHHISWCRLLLYGQPVRINFFDEEITLGDFDIQGIIEVDKKKYEADPKHKEVYAEGQPVYMSGKELIKFRK